ncbi:MAG: flagellar assembly protein FliX [Pseudomonadota bacterium]
MIKVTGTTGPRVPVKQRDKSPHSGASVSFHDVLSQQETPASTPTAAVTGGLIPPPQAIVPDESQSKTWAKDILDQLDELRMDFLAGRVSPSRLEQIQKLIERIPPQDPATPLGSLIREIEIRARVELAKLYK